MRRKRFNTHSESGTDDVVILDINDQEFKCKSRIPGIVLMSWVSKIDMDDPAAAAGAVEEMLKAAIEDHEWDRFYEYISDPVNDVDLKTLSRMTGWLVEQYTGNPTPPSSDSSDGQRWNGRGSLAEVSATGGT